MSVFRRRTKHDKAGSNVRDAALRHAELDRDFLARVRPYTKAQAAFSRERRAVLTKPVIRAMAPVIDAIRANYARAALAASGDAATLRAARRRAQTAMTAALRKGVPGYQRLLRAREAYTRIRAGLTSRDLAAAKRIELPISLGGLQTFEPGAQVITPPFDFHDTHSSNFDVELLVFNESFVNPQTGILLTDVRFHHDEAGWGLYNPKGSQQIETSVGSSFIVPKSGSITCSAVVENLFNRVFCAVTDNFGLSSSHLTFDVQLFIGVVHRGELLQSRRLVTHNGIVSHGSALSTSFSDIPDHVPFTLRFTPSKTFRTGDRVDVFVGCLLTIVSDTDDMEAFVTAQLMWQVHKLTVGMLGKEK